MLTGTITKDQIAQVAHEAIAEFIEILDSKAHVMPWHLVDETIKVSTLTGVELVLEDPNITAEEIHQRWVDYKRGRGWVHGTEIDLKLKQHPNLVPFDELTPLEQAKDRIFIGVVRALAPCLVSLAEA